MSENKIMVGNEEFTEEDVGAVVGLCATCLLIIPVIGIGFGASVVWNHREKKKLKNYIKSLEQEIDYRKKEDIDTKNRMLYYIKKYRELKEIGKIEAADSWIDGIESIIR